MEVLEQRVALYKLISRIFLHELDEDTLRKIEKLPNFEELFPNFSEWEDRKLKSKYKLINEVLNVDFTDIAVMHLIPYESFYVRDDGMIETGGSNPVVQIYNEYNYRVNLDVARAVSGDHFAIEMAFMAMLVEAQKRAIEVGEIESANEIKNEQIKFLKEHLLQFAPMYLINVAEQARTPFYKDGAVLALEFLLEDYEALKGEL